MVETPTPTSSGMLSVGRLARPWDLDLGRFDEAKIPAVFLLPGPVGSLPRPVDPDPDPFDEAETESRASVPGLNHPCFLGFLNFLSFSCRLSSSSTACIFLAVLAAERAVPVYNEKGNAGKSIEFTVASPDSAYVW